MTKIRVENGKFTRSIQMRGKSILMNVMHNRKAVISVEFGLQELLEDDLFNAILNKAVADYQGSKRPPVRKKHISAPKTTDSAAQNLN